MSRKCLTSVAATFRSWAAHYLTYAATLVAESVAARADGSILQNVRRAVIAKRRSNVNHAFW